MELSLAGAGRTTNFLFPSKDEGKHHFQNYNHADKWLSQQALGMFTRFKCCSINEVLEPGYFMVRYN